MVDELNRLKDVREKESDAKRIEMVIVAESRFDEAIVEITKLRQENEAQKNYMEQILQALIVVNPSHVLEN